MKKFRIKNTIMLAVAGISISGVVMADTSIGTINMSATVNHSCKSLIAAPLIFPDYLAGSTSQTDASTQISVRCTMGTPVNIGLDKGIIGASEFSRQLTNGSSRLNYNIYTSAARTTVWNNTSSRVSATGQGLGTAMNFTVYGRIPAGQYGAVPGVYADNINVVVSY